MAVPANTQGTSRTLSRAGPALALGTSHVPIADYVTGEP